MVTKTNYIAKDIKNGPLINGPKCENIAKNIMNDP